MILKIRGSANTNEANVWQFIDNVTVVSAGIDGEHGEKIVEVERADGQFFSRDVTSGCFLLNDSGKTIERIS